MKNFIKITIQFIVFILLCYFLSSINSGIFNSLIWNKDSKNFFILSSVTELLIYLVCAANIKIKENK
jgi:hypothetical protein